MCSCHQQGREGHGYGKLTIVSSGQSPKSWALTEWTIGRLVGNTSDRKGEQDTLAVRWDSTSHTSCEGSAGERVEALAWQGRLERGARRIRLHLCISK